MGRLLGSFGFHRSFAAGPWAGSSRESGAGSSITIRQRSQDMGAEASNSRFLGLRRLRETIQARSHNRHVDVVCREIIQILRNLLKCCSFRLGLGILGVGTVVSFVGLGEKGFRSSELRLLGPILSGFGLALCIIRICLCCSGCDPRRRAPPSKLAAKPKKMKGGREPIQMVRIAEAVAFIPAIHQSAEIRSTPHAPTQIQHHTPVEVDPGC